MAQLAVAACVTATSQVLYYLPPLLLCGCLTGCILGLVGEIVLAHLQMCIRDSFREERVDCREVRDPKLGVLLSSSNNERLLRENPRYSINRMLALLDERLRTRIKFLADGMEKEEIQEKLREYKDHYKSRRPTESI